MVKAMSTLGKIWLMCAALACCSASASRAQERTPETRPDAVADTRPSADAASRASSESRPATRGSLEETRLTMSKWIETQQIISKERKDWQQGKDILVGSLEVVKQEISSLDDKIKKAES